MCTIYVFSGCVMYDALLAHILVPISIVRATLASLAALIMLTHRLTASSTTAVLIFAEYTQVWARWWSIAKRCSSESIAKRCSFDSAAYTVFDLCHAPRLVMRFMWPYSILMRRKVPKGARFHFFCPPICFSRAPWCQRKNVLHRGTLCCLMYCRCCTCYAEIYQARFHLFFCRVQGGHCLKTGCHAPQPPPLVTATAAPEAAWCLKRSKHDQNHRLKNKIGRYSSRQRPEPRRVDTKLSSINYSLRWWKMLVKCRDWPKKNGGTESFRRTASHVRFHPRLKKNSTGSCVLVDRVDW